MNSTSLRRPFFDTTVEALNSITALYDFLWPTTAAIWNLRWQVAGYFAVRPSASVAELQARFIEGSHVHGANLQRACIDTSWDDQAAILGGVLLTNLFAVYEGWLKRLVGTLHLPISGEKKLAHYGAASSLQTLQTPTSRLIEESIYPVLMARRSYDLAQLDNLMIAYRYFKALRNKQLHDHGVADKVCEKAYQRFVPVATPAALGVVEVPQYFPVVSGTPVKISLRGVVGFSELLRKMVFTIDAELARAQAAEPIFEAYWLRIRPSSHLFRADPDARRRQIEKTFKRMGFAGVNVTSDIEKGLVAKGLVRHQ
jgi:hypothetical protein